MTNRWKNGLSMDYEHTQHGRLHYIFFAVTTMIVIRVGTDDVDGLARFLKEKRLAG